MVPRPIQSISRVSVSVFVISANSWDPELHGLETSGRRVYQENCKNKKYIYIFTFFSSFFSVLVNQPTMHSGGVEVIAGEGQWLLALATGDR